MKYFEGLTLADDIKARYKELAKQWHPDLGGCTETMKEINRQYEQVLSGIYQKAGKSITEVEGLLADDIQLMEKLNAIIAIPGLIIELCGSWLWVTGETKTASAALKEAGYFWASKKLAWYWRKPEDKKRSFKVLSMDEIRSKHGRNTISAQERRKIG